MVSPLSITSLAVAIAVTAAVGDCTRGRIPNWVTYPAAAVGIVLQTVLLGRYGFVMSLTGGLAAFGIFFLFYVVRAMGAGDVKLAAALGFIVGLEQVLPILAASAIAGGVLAVIYMIAYRRFGLTLRNTASVIAFHGTHGLETHPSVNLDKADGPRMPYGLAFAAGTLYWAIAMLWWR